MSDRVIRGVATIGGVVFLSFGLWAAVAPESFYRSVAKWPPYNVHFVHDIGAFQIGLAAALLLALVRADSLSVALAAAAAGQTAHAVMHLIDRDLGGKSSDPIVMVVLAVFFVAAAWSRWRRGSGRSAIV